MSSDKSENLSNSPSACEKVCTAIFCCRCSTNSDVLDHQEEHVPAFTTTNNLQPTHDHSAKASDVQAKSRRSDVVEHKPELPSKEGAKKGSHGQTHAENEGKKSSSAKNEMFSEYINRAKLKIRAMSGLGIGITTSEADDVHDAKKDNSGGKDVFSDYINRAKVKIRKTPSIGSRKSGSLE
ncbi:hypothetical protein TIFTF001_000997 [Ficus carica]|uniref:Uncharacterized protein n=1 Tax=Ficus carica TaxID=3494 RepID=A0AA88D392_FICCA|nr:hypothetical protein TIFTF001_000997 [Ficus carica]